MKKSLLILTLGLTLSQQGWASAETRTTPFGQLDPGPAYEVNWLVDLPAIAISGGISLSFALSDAFPPPYCGVVQPCDKGQLWAIDKPLAGHYDANWDQMSDIVLYSLMGGALVTLLADEHWKHALNDLVVITEAVMISSALYSVTALAARRPRPYMYGEEAPEERRSLPRSSFSFFSGHTATAFSMTTALFSTIRRRRPGSSLQWIVLGAGLTLSAAVGAGRIASGYHFPTDVLIGALVGSSVGLAIPALHQTAPQSVRLIKVENGLGLSLRW